MEMPRKLLFPLCCALALLLMAGCGTVTAKPAPVSPAPSQTDTPPPEETTPPAEPSPDKSGAEYAYFVVFEHLFSVDPGLNGGINYLAVDLSSVCAADTDAIARLFEDFCKENNLTLLLDTYAGLVEKGYITDYAFEDGLFVRFEDESLSEECLITRAQKWRAGDGADGAAYTVSLNDGKWEITKIAGMWIS